MPVRRGGLLLDEPDFGQRHLHGHLLPWNRVDQVFLTKGQLIEEVKRNMAACKVAENTEVLGRIRDHIMAILASMGSMPGIMRQMPPLPIQLDLELANRILPPPKPPNPQAASH